MERLLKLLEQGFISPELYFKKLEEYEEQLLEKYLNGEITLEELCKRIDK